MNDLQKRLLVIFKAFAEVCEKHNLSYFLNGGSCLGAIRHKGFIPWDDDIDVMMPREDYEKFLTLQKEYEGTPYFIQCWKTDPHYIYGYAKLRDSSTTFIEDNYVNHRINHGVWIDIFPIDGMSKKPIDRAKCAKKVKFIWWQTYMAYLPALLRKVHKRTFFKDIGLNIVGGLFYILDIAHFRNRRMDRYAKKLSINDSALSGNMFGFTFKKAAMDSDIFKDYVYVDFEDTKARVMKRYDDYLTLIFGDYMTPPPVKEQEGHHYNKGFSLEEGYEEYMKRNRM